MNEHKVKTLASGERSCSCGAIWDRDEGDECPAEGKTQLVYVSAGESREEIKPLKGSSQEILSTARAILSQRDQPALAYRQRLAKSLELVDAQIKGLLSEIQTMQADPETYLRRLANAKSTLKPEPVELEVVGYCDSDGFLNKHCHGDYSEPVCLVAEAEEVIAKRDARIEEQAREIERLKAHGAKWLKRAENWSELKAQPARGVVLPERAELDRMWREIQDSVMRSQESPHIRFAEQLARLNSSPVSAGDTKRAAKSARLEKSSSEAIDIMRARAMYLLQTAVYHANSKSNQMLEVDSDLWDAVAGVRVAYEELARIGLPEVMKNHLLFIAGGVDEQAAFARTLNLQKRDDGCYVNSVAGSMLEAWQARAALTAGGAVPDGDRVREAARAGYARAMKEVAKHFRLASGKPGKVSLWALHQIRDFATTAKKEG